VLSVIHGWITPVVVVATVVLVVEVVRRLIAGALASRWPDAALAARRCGRPALVTAMLISARAVVPDNAVVGIPDSLVRQVLWIGVSASSTWMALRIGYALTDPALARLDRAQGRENRRARRLRTQMLLVRRIVAAVIVVIAVGAALYTFPAVRALGAGVLASAGAAGLVAGIAARPALGNLMAGLQLAFSDAVRLGDVVVVENLWGRIEELTLTYVVVHLWDERRLILPVSYFAQNPFENWTRHSSRVLGSVDIHVDWSVPVEEVRTELHRIVQDHSLWDRREWTLQVTDVLPNGLVQLRAWMSAADAPSAWDLRCDVRERLVSYLRDKHPDALPRYRAELLPSGDGRAPPDSPAARG
jgi:small-conductance mechanosensitive channel